MAEPDHCSPREMTVDLELRNADPDLVYYPRCTKVMRCGGCCSSKHVSCEPVEVERSVLNVLKGQVPFPEADYLIFADFEKVLVERHLSCRTRCKLSQSKCGAHKTFLPRQCACACNKTQSCDGNRVWDPETCRCTCARTRKCMRGQIFSQESCQCKDDFNRQDASHDETGSISSLDKYLVQQKKYIRRGKPSETVQLGPSVDDRNVRKPEADTFIMRPAKAGTEQDGVCSGLHCPPFFYAVEKSDLCVCTPKKPSGSYYRRKLARSRSAKKRHNKRRWRKYTKKQARQEV
ncbi:vascular endothelial growth factor A [Elysia marginata]|uniref:Vascular endothelial growth factor A n=1 Tax=Elysia marginata TaxID=1093978 RepID=A0AAV4G7V0_9GAST|nr:vascular endothelial growth factor A [Elysia marginata]